MLKLAHSQHDLNVRFCSAEIIRNLWNTEFHRLASGKTAWWSGKKRKAVAFPLQHRRYTLDYCQYHTSNTKTFKA